jgi:plastocyanin
MALQIRRGTDAERLSITPVVGELIYTTDTKILYAGDGNTVGGIIVTGTQINLANITTANIVEGSNLYYTNTRVQNYLSNISGNVLPSSPNVFNLGSPSNRWNTLYLAGNTLDLGGTAFSVANNLLQVTNTANPNVGISLVVSQIQIGTGNSAVTLQGTASGLQTLTSSNSTVVVPTHTSNLVNDSGFIGLANISLTTSNIAEGSNLYYSNARAVFGTIPASTRLVVTTPVFNYNIDQYTGDNPTIYVKAGDTIAFALNQGASHPLVIRESNGGANITSGLTHVANDGTVTLDAAAQGKIAGALYWKVPYSLAGNTYVYQCTAHSGMVGNIVIQKFVNNTTELTEGANLYFTNARVLAALTAGNNISISNGIISATSDVKVADLNTSNVVEGSNLYFTNARVVSALTSGTGISIDANGVIATNVSAIVSGGNGITVSNTGVIASNIFQVISAGTGINLDPNGVISGNVTTLLTAGNNMNIAANGLVTANANAILLSSPDVAFNNVRANSFISTSSGVPTLQSNTNINLTANNAVVITNSPLRLRNYNSSQVANLAASNGDIVFSTTNNTIQTYTSGSWKDVLLGPVLQLINLTQAEVANITAGNGTIIYNTTNNKVQAYANGVWVDLH